LSAEARGPSTEAGEQRSSFEVAGDRYLRVSRSLRGRYDPVLRSDIVGAVTLDMRLALTDAAVTRDLVSEMTLVLALCIPIGSLLYLRTRRTLVRPLDQLAAAGAQFTRGEVPAPLTFSGRDELAGVARTFNEMVAARTAAMKERERQLAILAANRVVRPRPLARRVQPRPLPGLCEGHLGMSYFRSRISRTRASRSAAVHGLCKSGTPRSAGGLARPSLGE